LNTRDTELPNMSRENAEGFASGSVEEALERARTHARAAAAEGIEVLRALLDVGSLATSGVPADSHRVLARIATLLEDLAASLGGSTSNQDASLGRTLADAIDLEIARWEARAADDAEARAVLRAFLGLRELLWEIGVRPTRNESTRAGRPVHEHRADERARAQG